MIVIIKLTQRHCEQILNYCQNEAPNEACGLLGGIIDEDVKIVKKVYLLTNVDQCPEHFSMDPQEQFAAIKDMRTNGWFLLGNFHSHPKSPSRPSEEDKRLAFDPEVSYLILSLMEEGYPILKSFRIQKDTVSEETIKIIAGGA